MTTSCMPGYNKDSIGSLKASPSNTDTSNNFLKIYNGGTALGKNRKQKKNKKKKKKKKKKPSGIHEYFLSKKEIILECPSLI